MQRNWTEIMQDEMNIANPIIESDFDEIEPVELMQYCEFMDTEEFV